MTHTSTAASPLNVDSALTRVSVGLDGVDDLITELDQALSRG
jgi:cystathionine beta-lyase/cystathionine gamma-synthase